MRRCVQELAACLALLAALPVLGASPDPHEIQQRDDLAGKPMSFAIPPQPLSDALRAYSEATGVAVLFDNDLVASRRSPGANGTFAREQALDLLFVGTGLTARYASPNSFTVAAMDAPGSAIARGDAQGTLSTTATAVLQRAILRALCVRASTRPGNFRLAMQLWFDTTGRIVRVQPLATSGEKKRDDDIVATLQGEQVASMPAMASPLTIVLQPVRPDAPPACPAGLDG